MGHLARFVRFCFGLQALGLVGAVPTTFLLMFVLMRGDTLHWYTSEHPYTAEDFPGGVVLVGLLALVLEIVPAIAWWKLKKGHPSARPWALAASVASLPIPIPGLDVLRFGLP